MVHGRIPRDPPAFGSEEATTGKTTQQVSKLTSIPTMAGDGVSTRLQKEDKFRGDLQTLLGQYFGPPTIGVIGKGKGVMGGAPPCFAPKDFVTPNASQVLAEVSVALPVDVGSVHLYNRSPLGIILEDGGLSWSNSSRLKELLRQTKFVQ
ncbi:hypothetical protein GOBAR_AA01386 [Gossypium barbadense]|uniref:Uncharacterized protein n=1 Tax=Gossypium barbadense TaxID=3634 RepID=A0A2P5YUD9_GOSBA|nr:hypothetical protein GOBAR_AA01386 [Gossypium barbadense]